MATPLAPDDGARVTVEAQTEAENFLLGWQLHGVIGAIDAVLEELGSFTRGFFAPHDRIQAAIFDAHKRGTGTAPAAIALQLAGDDGLAELGGLDYLRTLATAAPVVADVRRAVHAAAATWHSAKTFRAFAQRTEEIASMFKAGDAAALSELKSAGRELADSERGGLVIATPFAWREPESLPRRQWVFSRHAIRRFLSVTAAAGGAGKTSLAFADALSVSTGKALLNDGRIERCRVWYIGLEDPLEEYQRRVAATAILHRLSSNDLQGLFLDSARDQNFILAREANESVIAEPVAKAIIAQIRRHDIGLVIVDPFVNCHELNEQDNTAIATLMKQWAAIADETGCAIELLHHTRKTNGNAEDDSADEVRGAGAFVNAARSVRRLVRMTKDEASRAGVDDRRRFFRVVSGTKSNLMLHSDDSHWRELVSIDLGNGDEFHPADRVQAVASWRFPDAADDCSQEQLGRILEELRPGSAREDVRSPDWAGNIIARILDLDVKDEAAKSSVKAAMHKWIADGTLRIVERTDEKTRKLRRYVVPA